MEPTTVGGRGGSLTISCMLSCCYSCAGTMSSPVTRYASAAIHGQEWEAVLLVTRVMKESVCNVQRKCVPK